MIQRIQSLYILGIIAILVSFFFLSFGQVNIADGKYILDYSICGLYDMAETSTYQVSTSLIYGYVITLVIFNVIIILSFKNRKRQLKLVKINSALLSILIAMVLLYADYLVDSLNLEETYKINYGIASFLTFLPLALNYLAMKSIRKDEELVRSADRLR